MRAWKWLIMLAPTALAAVPANAAVIDTVSATYDAFLQNSVFTVSNLSGLSESVTFRTSLGPTTSVGPFTIAAGGTYTYAFNAVDGGYGSDPEAAGVPDTTTYSLNVQVAGITANSASFSPTTNATGNYVDFLGNTCGGFSPCSVATSGTVATVSATLPVPEPATFAVLAAGLIGLAAARRRA